MFEMLSRKRCSRKVEEVAMIGVLKVIGPQKSAGKAQEVPGVDRKGGVKQDCREHAACDGCQEIVALDRTSAGDGSLLKSRRRCWCQRKIISSSCYIGCRKPRAGLSDIDILLRARVWFCGHIFQ
jgi:hypothetical protein